VHNPLSRNRYCGARHSIYRDRGELLSGKIEIIKRIGQLKLAANI